MENIHNILKKAQGDAKDKPADDASKTPPEGFITRTGTPHIVPPKDDPSDSESMEEVNGRKVTRKEGCNTPAKILQKFQTHITPKSKSKSKEDKNSLTPRARTTNKTSTSTSTPSRSLPEDSKPRKTYKTQLKKLMGIESDEDDNSPLMESSESEEDYLEELRNTRRRGF